MKNRMYSLIIFIIFITALQDFYCREEPEKHQISIRDEDSTYHYWESDDSKVILKYLNDSLSKYMNIIYLDIMNISMQTYPDFFYKFNSLRRIRISQANNSNLSDLFEKLKNNKNIEELTITFSNLTEFPEEILNFPKLKKLNIRWCDFNSLPIEIGTLKYLEKLEINNSKFIYFPETVKELIKLSHVRLSHPQTKELPENFDLIPNLEFLEIFNKDMGNIDNYLRKSSKINSLKRIDLELDTLITFLPKELFNIRSLDCIFISWSRITEVPPEICNLTNLKVLGLMTNSVKITDFPECIYSMKELRILIHKSLYTEEELEKLKEKFKRKIGF